MLVNADSREPELSIIIVNWNTRELLSQCLQSLTDTVKEISYEVWVVDNNSSDHSVEMIQKRFPRFQVIANSENAGFVRANNQAIACSRGRFLLLLNSDTVTLPDSICTMVRFMDEHPRAGGVGVRLLNPDRTFQASYTPFPTLWNELLMLSGLGRWLIRPSYPSYGPLVQDGPKRIQGYMEGACLMVRREAINQIGGLDEHIYMYSEEVDWCFRFHVAGWELWYLPNAPIVHYGGQSSKKRQGRMEAELYRSRVYFFHKHYGKLAALCLKYLIYLLTLPKMILHRLLRLITKGRRGRTVTSWRELHLALKSVGSAFEEGVAA